MKIRRLLEVDLARLAPLPIGDQRRRMTKLVGGGGFYSLQPTRDQLCDTMNVQPPLFEILGPSPVTSFAEIESALKRSCRSREELAANLQVSKMLYEHFRAENVISRAHGFGSMPLGLDRGIRYWTSAYYGRGGVPVVTFIEPRGGQGLTSRARDVVFSAMYASICERDPDFASAILEIIQLPYVDGPKKAAKSKSVRRLRVYTLSGPPPFTFEELDTMLTATLRLWDDVCAEAAERRAQAGGSGTLI